MKKVLLLFSILSIFSCAPDFDKPRETNSPVVAKDSVHTKDTIQEIQISTQEVFSIYTTDSSLVVASSNFNTEYKKKFEKVIFKRKGDKLDYLQVDNRVLYGTSLYEVSHTYKYLDNNTIEVIQNNTLESIAEDHDISIRKLVICNPGLRTKSMVRVGQIINLNCDCNCN